MNASWPFNVGQRSANSLTDLDIRAFIRMSGGPGGLHVDSFHVTATKLINNAGIHIVGATVQSLMFGGGSFSVRPGSIVMIDPQNFEENGKISVSNVLFWAGPEQIESVGQPAPGFIDRLNFYREWRSRLGYHVPIQNRWELVKDAAERLHFKDEKWIAGRSEVEHWKVSLLPKSQRLFAISCLNDPVSMSLWVAGDPTQEVVQEAREVYVKCLLGEM